MSSTNIFTGLNDGRNSSRVLRPPGGGHTDVLGLHSQPNEQQPKKPSPRNISSIVEGTNQLQPSPDKKQDAKPTPTVKETEPEKLPPTTTTNQRARVPPGGFSSGLW